MRLRLLPASLLVLGVSFGLSFGAATASPAQEIRMLAFGDSITVGYGDTSNPGGGYPPRLQRWLRQRGYDATVENFGVGGETTSSGLSRIDSVLATGGDFLLLMEGTNDISQRVGVESIRFNLDEMAGRAEALGISVVHASVIPRIPSAPADADNSATSALALAIRTMGTEKHRAVADQFTLFESLPNVFENYYFYDPEVPDIVGHPNTDGYIEIGGLFLETLLPLLDTPAIEIVPPPAGVEAGFLVGFGVNGNAVEQFVQVEWDFGDGGYAQTPPPGDLSTFYMFLHPGTYTVRVRAFTAGGAVAEDSVQVVVSGNDPAWQTATSLLPAVVETNDGQIVTDLELFNAGLFFGIAEVTFLPEIDYDAPLPVRRFMIAPVDSTWVEEVLPTAFGVGTGRGALKVVLYAAPADNLNQLSARALVRAASDSDGGDGATVAGIPSASWTAAGKQILGIPFGPNDEPTLSVTNLDGVRGTVRFELLDGVGATIGSGVLELEASSSRLRSIRDLFRGLDHRATPFRAVFAASTLRFTAAAIVIDPASDEVRVLTGTP